MKDWSSIYTYKLARQKYERDKKIRHTSSFNIIQNMLHQGNKHAVNALVRKTSMHRLVQQHHAVSQ